LVKVIEEVRFPGRYWRWLSTRAVGPQNGRVLIEVRGHSGQSSWPEVLLTAPEGAVKVEEKNISLLPGKYRVEEGQDRRGMRLLRVFQEETDTNLIMFSVDGFLVPEASDPEVREIAKARGKSRTGLHGDCWSLLAGPVGAIVAVQGYEARDPRYYRVTPEGLACIGESDAVIHPSEW
jgi:hypothetical protein